MIKRRQKATSGQHEYQDAPARCRKLPVSSLFSHICSAFCVAGLEALAGLGDTLVKKVAQQDCAAVTRPEPLLVLAKNNAKADVVDAVSRERDRERDELKRRFGNACVVWLD